MKILHITHNDLDAVGCDLIARLYARSIGKDIITKFVNVSVAHKIINECFQMIENNELTDIDEIIISDLSLNEKTGELINNFIVKSHINLVHLDHHASTILDNVYSWCTVNRDTPPISAAMMMFNTYRHIISENIGKIDTAFVFEFIENVSRYDTWMWKRDYRDGTEEWYNILCKFYGPQEYSDILFTNTVNNHVGPNFISKTDKVIIENYIRKRDEDVKSVISNPNRIYIKKDPETGFTFGYILQSGEYVNSVMEAVYLNYPNIDVVAALFPTTRTISFRSNKDYVDCSKIAIKYGGGGHKTASGAGFIDIDLFVGILNEFYKGIDKQRKESFKKRNGILGK